MSWKTILKRGGKWATYPLRHPGTTLREGGSAVKSGVIGAGVGYVGWQALVNDKPVVRTVSDIVIGSDNVDKITETVSSAVDTISDVTQKAGDAFNGVSEAVDGVNQQSGAMAGMGNFIQSLTSGNGLNMIGDFFKGIGEGKVSGLSFAGLIGAALLIFGRFGWFGKIAGAILGMMILGNNVDMNRVMGKGTPAQPQAETPEVTEGERQTGTHRRR